jgi:hypothetical protein
MAQRSKKLLLRIIREVRVARDLVVGHRAAQILGRDLLPDGRFDHVRAGNEHLADALGHEDEVRQCGRVDGTAGARPHQNGNLRDHAGGQRVAEEDLAVAG